MRHIAVLLTLLSVSASADIDRLAWLAGCWANDGGDPGSGEMWTIPAGGTMLATTRNVHDNHTYGFEFLRIATDEDGGLVLYAQPGGKPPTAFIAVEFGASSVVFENKGHDFPQRVIYRRDGDVLLGRIEGTLDGEERAMDFPMHRIDCESASP